MAQTDIRPVTLERVSAALQDAADLCAEAATLVGMARVARERAGAFRSGARARRHPSPVNRRSVITAFEVRGLVDDTECRAVWRGDVLELDALLVSRAELVVAMGDTFAASGGAIGASLDDPRDMACLLTIMRAFSRITSMAVDWAADRKVSS
jgi:hypothetical protein